MWVDRSGSLPDVPWPTAVVIGLFGASVLFSALALRPRLRGRDGHRPVAPLVSARFGVLSLASSRAGALFVGIYGGFLATALTDLTIDYRRHVAIVSGLCVLASGVLVTVGSSSSIPLAPPPTPTKQLRS